MIGTKKLAAGFLLLAVLINLCLSSPVSNSTAEDQETEASRVKRGYGGGGGGGGGGGYGHGPGKGGGASGPVYFCGYVGKSEGSSYGHGK